MLQFANIVNPIGRISRVAFIDIACQLWRLSASYPERSSFPARVFRFETAITVERASKRIKFIISANARGSLSQVRREKQRQRMEKKEKRRRLMEKQRLAARGIRRLR